MLRFQSTLPRGSDHRRRYQRSVLSYFNPRSLAGATGWSDESTDSAYISIHAPSRERLTRCYIGSLNILFQSTLPRGSDVSPSFGMEGYCDFNPRSLVGATYRREHQFHSIVISIHAPSRERRSQQERFRFAVGFQSTLPRGSDVGVGDDRRIFRRFQSTLPRGSDHNPEEELYLHIISIHAPSRERRLALSLLTELSIFQSTLPRGSDDGD